MKQQWIAAIISGALIGAPMASIAPAQEHKHEEHQSEQKAPAKKSSDAEKTGGMKCCEGMDKMGEMMGNMKAKMEKMQGMKMKESKVDAKSDGLSKDKP